MKKVTYILSNIDKAIAFEWIVAEIDQSKFELSFILLHSKTPYLYQWLKDKGIEAHFLPHYGKKSFIKNFFKICQLLNRINPNIVHCHLLDADIIGLFAAKLLGMKKRIYTRHHATFHHEYFPKAVKYDKLCNWLATDIVAISENVKNVLTEKENVKPNKIHLIHHGFDLQRFSTVSPQEIVNLKAKYNIKSNDYPKIGVVARYINWKGHLEIIKAFKKLLESYPNAKLILANATGPNKLEVQQLLQKELTPNQFTEILFEPNLFALYQLFDVYVHTPINADIEAFGQTYVEALVSKIPSVFTLSGVAKEFIKDKENALVVNFKDSDAIYNAIKTIVENQKLSNKLVINGLKSVVQFNLNLFIQKLEQLYA